MINATNTHHLKSDTLKLFNYFIFNLEENDILNHQAQLHKLAIHPLESSEHALKGIVSGDFGTLFFISLDRFEGRNRAG
jgi:hypothetical protein